MGSDWPHVTVSVPPVSFAVNSAVEASGAAILARRLSHHLSRRCHSLCWLSTVCAHEYAHASSRRFRLLEAGVVFEGAHV